MFDGASAAACASTFIGAFDFSFGDGFGTFVLFSGSAGAAARFMAMLLER
jgi:hypothetical protein